MARPEGPMSEAPRAERGGCLGMFLPSARGFGERYKLAQWSPGRNPSDLAIYT